VKLFRQQALDVRNASSFGTIMLQRSWASWITVAAVCALLTAALACLYMSHYTRRTTVSGVLQPASGSVRILASGSDVIMERHVQEGQAVRRGDVLFVLSDTRRAAGTDGRLSLAETQAMALEQRRASTLRALDALATLREQTESGLRLRLEAALQQLRQNEQEVDVHTRRVAAAERMLERQRTLAREQFISEAALQDKIDQVDLLSAQRLSTSRQRSELQGAVLALQAELQQTATRSASQTEALQREYSALNQEAAELRTRDRAVIVAPQDGTITAITAQVGQQVGPQPLAVLLPVGTQLFAQLFAPPRAAGFLAPGQRVRLRYEAFPYQKFGQHVGVVREVSRSPIPPTELAALLPFNFTAPEAVFRLTVELDRQDITAYGLTVPLVTGMTLEADVEHERRRLIEWVIEPLTALRRHVS
jgi:membrane fusion protein